MSTKPVIVAVILVSSISLGLASGTHVRKQNPPGQTIKSVIETSTGHVIGRDGIIDPSSGMTVNLDTVAIAKYVNTDDAAASDLKDLTALVQATNDGLREVQAFVTAKPPRNTAKLFQIVLGTNAIFKKHPQVYADLNSKLVGLTIPQQLKVYFQETTVLADSITQSLASELPALQVRLNQSRDPDQSRTPDVDLAHVFGPDALTAQQNLLTQLGLPSNGGFTADQLATSIASSFKAAIASDFDKLTTSANSLVSQYEKDFAAILTSQDQNARGLGQR